MRWQKSTVIFDTNAILRYILQDNDEMASLVENEIATNSCLIPIEVVAEMVYVLSKVYKVERPQIKQAVLGIFQQQNISTSDINVVFKAIDVYAATRLDFVDCLMVGYATVRKYTVFTFDKDLRKHLR